MLYGIISDVHGNMEALRPIVARLRELKVERIAFLGDAVGYGSEPNAVCDMLREITDVAITGNHDAAVSGRMDYREYYEAARLGLDWCAARMTPDNMGWLESLPYIIREHFIDFSHGAPIQPELFDYVFSPEQVIFLLDDADKLADVTFIGHSHLTVAFKIEGDVVTSLRGHEFYCDPAAKYIITAGSVGQPRDRDPRACCGTFDTETRLFEYHRVAYDTRAARQKILDAGLPEIFGERLLVGM